MTMPAQIRCTCAVCGTASEQTALASTNTAGSPDLDQRPPEMLRSTMHWWLQECPVCGYVSDSLEDRTNVDRRWLRSPDYQTCSGIAFTNGLARQFYRQYLINLEDRNPEMAFRAALRCAWVCDDRKEEPLALRCRMLALFSLEELLQQKPGDPDLMLIRADLLRRTGMYHRLLAQYSGTRFSDGARNDVLAFQLEKARLLDDRCYTVEDVRRFFHPDRKEGVTIPLDLRYFSEDLWRCPVCSAGNLPENRRCIACGAQRKD